MGDRTNDTRVDLDAPRSAAITAAMWAHLQRTRRGRYCVVGAEAAPAEAGDGPEKKRDAI